MDLRFENLDASEGVFFSRQLEHLKAQTYPVLYPEFKARQFVPMDGSAGDGVTQITYRMEDQFGAAKLISDYAADLPRADVKGSEHSQAVRDVGVSFGYSLREIRAAARAGEDLDGRKSRAARRASELTLDDIACFGDAAAGLKGFLNHASVDVDDATTGTWSAATPAQIMADVNEWVSDMRDATNGIHGNGLSLLLPDAQYTHIAQTRVDAVSDATILKFILGTNPFIKEIAPWYKLKDAGADGIKDRAVLYERSPDVVTLEIPAEFEMLAPQERNLEVVVPCRLVTAGVIMYRPKAVLYRDDI